MRISGTRPGAGNPGTDMQSNIRDAARRSPRQERSRAKVEAILAAAEEIVADDIADLTTSIIAERAGISVGSLYQYFENREDVVDRLLERYRVRLDEITNKVFADSSLESLGAGVTAVLDRYVELLRSDVAFRVLWYSTEFINPYRTVVDPADHALTRSFSEAAYQHGLLFDRPEDRLLELFSTWTAIDAVVHAAFRFDTTGQQEILDEARRLAIGLGTHAAA